MRMGSWLRVNKQEFYRVLQCSMMYYLGKSQIEINRHFNFSEMETARKICEVCEVLVFK